MPKEQNINNHGIAINCRRLGERLENGKKIKKLKVPYLMQFPSWTNVYIIKIGRRLAANEIEKRKLKILYYDWRI